MDCVSASVESSAPRGVRGAEGGGGEGRGGANVGARCDSRAFLGVPVLDIVNWVDRYLLDRWCEVILMEDY